MGSDASDADTGAPNTDAAVSDAPDSPAADLEGDDGGADQSAATGGLRVPTASEYWICGGADAQSHCETTYVDEQGRAVGFVPDVGCDGIPDWCEDGFGQSCPVPYVCWTAEYDDDGRRVAKSIDQSCDGTTCRVSYFDNRGRQTATGVDVGCDDELDAGCAYWTYVGEHPDWATYAYSANCDDNRTACQTRVLDESGTVVSSSNDGDCDGEPDEPAPSCPRLLMEEIDGVLYSGRDFDCDGVRDGQCQRQTRDEEGRETLLAADNNCDGREDWCIASAYAELPDGERRFWDSGCDGTIDDCTDRISDGMGTEGVRNDLGCDGSYELCRSRTVDEQGREVGVYYDPACGPPEAPCLAREYDDADRLVATRTDHDCDGAYDLCEIARYRPDGSLEFRGVDLVCEGTFDRDCAWTERRQTVVSAGVETVWEEYRDADCDGVAERSTACTFERAGERNGVRFVSHGVCDQPIRGCSLMVTIPRD